MAQLESLKTVATFRFLPDHVQNRVDELSSLGVVSLSPVVSCSGLSEHEVVWSENLSERSRSDGVHGSGFQVHKDSTGDVFSSSGLVVVDIDPLELEIRVSVVGSSGVDSMLVRDNLVKRYRLGFVQIFSNERMVGCPSNFINLKVQSYQSLHNEL